MSDVGYVLFLRQDGGGLAGVARRRRRCVRRVCGRTAVKAESIASVGGKAADEWRFAAAAAWSQLSEWYGAAAGLPDGGSGGMA